MAKEVKIALLAIVTIALFYWGYKFIIGKNVLSQSNIFYVKYENVDMLQKSSPVVINGYEVGFVSNIFLQPQGERDVVVQLDLRKDIRIPQDTRAEIVATGFMGGKAIELQYEDPCFGEGCAASGDTLRGRLVPLLNSMVGKEELENYVAIIREGLKQAVGDIDEELLGRDKDTPLANSVKNLEKTLANLEVTSQRMNRLLANSSEDINGTLSNLRSITDTLSNSRSSLASIINNADAFSTDLANAKLDTTITEVRLAINQLNETLATADEAVAGVNATFDQLEAGEGTLGKLLADEELYYRLSSLSTNADSLLHDIQERPYRYVPFKSRRKVKKFDRKDAAAAEQAAKETDDNAVLSGGKE